MSFFLRPLSEATIDADAFWKVSNELATLLFAPVGEDDLTMSMTMIMALTLMISN